VIGLEVAIHSRLPVRLTAPFKWPFAIAEQLLGAAKQLVVTEGRKEEGMSWLAHFRLTEVFWLPKSFFLAGFGLSVMVSSAVFVARDARFEKQFGIFDEDWAGLDDVLLNVCGWLRLGW